MQGVIERLVPERGFGFIQGEDGREFFFHQTGLMSTEFSELAVGHRVEFSVNERAQGDRPTEEPRAVAVRLAGLQPAADDNESLPPEKVNPLL